MEYRTGRGQEIIQKDNILNTCIMCHIFPFKENFENPLLDGYHNFVHPSVRTNGRWTAEH